MLFTPLCATCRRLPSYLTTFGRVVSMTEARARHKPGKVNNKLATPSIVNIKAYIRFFKGKSSVLDSPSLLVTG